MSTLDYNTAIRDIRVANDDFIQLLAKLHDFLTTNKTLKFYFGDETVVIDGLLALIDNYKNGRFTSVTIGVGDNSVLLSVDTEGNLKVSDINGNLVGVVCSGLSFSDISDTTIDSATMTECNIESVVGDIKVSGGEISLESLHANNLSATSLVARNISTTIATIEESHTTDMYIQGDRRMAFSDTRNVFYEGGVTIDSFVEKMEGGYSGANPIWVWDNCVAKPSMLGLQQQNLGTLPNLITICGNNKYSDFMTFLGRPFNINNVVGFAFVDNTPAVKVSLTEVPLMASVFLWPYAAYEGYVFTNWDNKNIYVSEFKPEDIGKEIYYRTAGSAWTIYRTLTIHYNNQQAISASLGTPYEIPPYSCVKFIVNRTGTVLSGIVSILELA